MNINNKKLIIILSFFLFVCNNLYSQVDIQNDTLRKTPNSISFMVSDVEVTTLDIAETTYKRAIEKKINRIIEGYPIEQEGKNLIATDLHPFLAALHFAYAEH
ncbi:MAG: hypothetical protein JXL97_19275 [Bacteroidales bacterium]|nr:hypothetical protein [Bacteroidales bacterium]